jgi:hypothetical protein
VLPRRSRTGNGYHRRVLSLARSAIGWYDEHARDLPWRAPGVGAWAVLVSEVMLQQTPVARVSPVWQEWIARWPTPATLAAEPAAEAIRAWGRLGYPRRALRLHECARVLVDRHGGEVPTALPELLALPGIGGYTARAVAAFAYRQRHYTDQNDTESGYDTVHVANTADLNEGIEIDRADMSTGLTWSPGGQALALGSSGRVGVYSVISHTFSIVSGDGRTSAYPAWISDNELWFNVGQQENATVYRVRFEGS